MSGTLTPFEPVSDPTVVGPQLRERLRSAYDEWLTRLVPDRPGIALVAVGSLGRGESAPYSDLDLVLLHSLPSREVVALADSIWYPIWDAGLGLDHSVRTVDEALRVARTDIKAMLGLLDVRHIAGDAELTASLRSKLTLLWRSNVLRRTDELRSLSTERAETHGELAFLLEPNLKDSAGGLRDWTVLHAFSLAQLIDLRSGAAHSHLLDVRGELHRYAGRRTDVLRAQDRDSIAAALGLADADALLRSVNDAGRTISYAAQLAWRRVGSLQPRRFGARRNSRVGLAKDIVAQNGDVVLARDADPARDPGLTMRAARAAAHQGMPISPFTLERLRAADIPIPQPWPDQIRDDFVGLLAAGPRAVPVLESLDQHGLLERHIQQWPQVRSLAQHNPVHRYTVDRHLIETVVQAGAQAADVRRPDLLLVGALLHDIGKAYPGDHSVEGAGVARQIAQGMGFSGPDADTIAALTRHHLLLPDTATRRDLTDPATIALVKSAIDGSPDVLELLRILTRADAAATGPAAWSEWKSRLVDELVARVHTDLAGTPIQAPDPVDPSIVAAAAHAGTVVQVHAGKGSAPSRVVFAGRQLSLPTTSGLLAMHSLDVRSATLRTVHDLTVHDFTVEPRFGSLPSPQRLQTDLARITDGVLDLVTRLAAKDAAYTTGPANQQLRMLWFDDEATAVSLLEVRTQDSIGLLHRLTSALEIAGLLVRSAKISSLGTSAVDAFYLTTKNGERVPQERRPQIESAIAAVG